MCDPKLFSFHAGAGKSVITVSAKTSDVCDPPPRSPRKTAMRIIRFVRSIRVTVPVRNNQNENLRNVFFTLLFTVQRLLLHILLLPENPRYWLFAQVALFFVLKRTLGTLKCRRDDFILSRSENEIVDKQQINYPKLSNAFSINRARFNYFTLFGLNSMTRKKIPN